MKEFVLLGYRSDIVIAIDKETYTRDVLLTDEFPSMLRQYQPLVGKDAVYWRLEGLKWYTSFADVLQVEQYFDRLILESNEGQFEGFLFGALRIGEDDEDIQKWGDPGQYEIFYCRSIDSPV